MSCGVIGMSRPVDFSSLPLQSEDIRSPSALEIDEVDFDNTVSKNEELVEIHNQTILDRVKLFASSVFSPIGPITITSLSGLLITIALAVLVTPVALKATFIFGSFLALDFAIKRIACPDELKASMSNIKKAFTIVTEKELLYAENLLFAKKTEYFWSVGNDKEDWLEDPTFQQFS